MSVTELNSIRNLALIGPAGAGKTTLADALLARTGAIKAAGSVEKGTTVSDHDPFEKLHGHSVQSSLLHFKTTDVFVNLIDTPGMRDFRGPALAALEAVETAALVINGIVGVDHQARRQNARAADRGLCRLLVVNHIDAEGFDAAAVLADIREAFGSGCLPVNLPADRATRVVDCFFRTTGESDLGPVLGHHQRIIDQVVEVDDAVMTHYLEEGESALSREELHDAFEACLRASHLVPVCFVSARNGVGIDELLEVIARLLPNPTEGNPPPFQKGEGLDAPLFELRSDPQAHAVAHVFKIISDPFLGQVSVFRVYQGAIRKDSELYIGHGRKAFKVGHLFRLQGKDTIEIGAVGPGEIAAVAKVDDIHFDAVLHDSHDEDHLHLKPMDFPTALFGLAIEPATRGQEQKLSLALAKLIDEDPCLRVEHHAELNETVLLGLGDVHLRVALERLRTRFNVDVTTRPPRIAYRETISTRADGHHRHKKQTGGAGQFGEVYLRIAPLERGAGFRFVNAVVGGAIPGTFIPAVEKGVRMALAEGAVAGYALTDIEVTVYDGKHHPVDSKEVAFASAGRKALLDAVSRARPIVLEPLAHLEVTVPADYVGDITGQLAAKRARIEGTDLGRGGMSLIRALVPLAELTDYATELKASSQGQGSYAVEIAHYEPVPAQVQTRLAQAYKPRPDEE